MEGGAQDIVGQEEAMVFYSKSSGKQEPVIRHGFKIWSPLLLWIGEGVRADAEGIVRRL